MPKKILYECYNLGLPKGTGIKTYVRELVGVARELGYAPEALLQSPRRMSKVDPLLAEIAYHDAPAKPGWREKYVRGALEYVVGAPFGIAARPLPETGVVMRHQGASPFAREHAAYRMLQTARRHLVRHRSLARVNVEGAPDLFHLTHAAPLKLAGAANVCTIHDVIPLRLPGATLDNKRMFLRTVRALCREMDHVVTVSECSRRDIVSVTGIPEDRISVTYQSVRLPPAILDRPAEDTVRILDNIFELEPQGYFLFFGALEPKKNVSRLIDAYAASGVSAPLVIAGGLGWSYETEVEQIDDDRFQAWRLADGRIRRERRVRRLDHVPFSHLAALIQGARGVLFPSLYEGFGLPVLEAMTLGAPVMTSNVSSLPEVAGDAALLVDPYDLDEMARAIVTLDRDADLRVELSRRGRQQALRFAPEIYRGRVEDVYRKLIG